MAPTFKLQCHFILICLLALRGESRYPELREAVDYDPFPHLSGGASPKRELEGEPLYSRALRCVDMLSLQGQFTFTADRPQLHCATFFIAEPEEFITIRYDLVSIDCQRGDILQVFDGWILKGEKFPSSQDHPLPTTERYIDFCESGLSRRTIRSSQNVAMIFFRVHEPGNGFTVTMKTEPNLFPCNIISQTPNGRFTLVVPHQHRNCSFSIIYPVAIKISDLTLGHLNGLQLKKSSAGCGGIGDFVELLGGTGLDPSKMLLLADLCYPLRGPVPLGYREQASGRHGQGPPRPGGAEAAFRCPRAPLAPGSAGVHLGLSAAPSAPTGRLAPDPMASEAPPPSLSPSPPPSPEPELAQLRRKVETLERELRSCKRQVREIEKLLHHTERLYQSAESNNQELRTQVEELSKILHCGKNEDNKKSDVEVQTENHPPWSISDYYYQTYYNEVDLPNKASELSVQEDKDIEASTFSSKDQSHIENDTYAGTDITENLGQEDHFASNSQEPASALATENASLEGSSLAESLRAAAEAAVSQTGFSYDENTGLYFDHSTGFYYDSENQLYYDPSTGIYYYCDVESGRYQFHSRVDLQPYQTSGTKQSKDKKLKKRRKDPDSSTTNEEKNLNSEDQKTSNIEHISCSEGEDFANVKKKAKVDIHYKNSPPKYTVPVSAKTVESPLNENIYNSASFKDEKILDTDSEPEEGEITDSQTEDSSDEDLTSEDNAMAGDTEDEDEEKIWPPCIRVIVIRSPVLQTGSLFIITAVNPATIGREKDMEHTLRIPEVGVSKFHAEIYFDHDLQSYVLVDQGSQNGTVVNGKQILQPKTKCDPYVLEHGDEVKIGETVLSFHIHPGRDTCDGCEPGQVRAHLRLDKKDELFVGPALSKEEKELERRKELKKIRVKYGLQNTDYEDEKTLKNPKYKDRAGKRREQIGSEGTFQRDDAPASVHSEITDSNKGRKMLEKMGWKKGEGLGKDGGGMKTPIQLQLRRTHAGLGTGKPSSIEDVQLLQNKSKKNWEKARERFAENFPEAKSQKDAPGTVPWVKGTVE